MLRSSLPSSQTENALLSEKLFVRSRLLSSRTENALLSEEGNIIDIVWIAPWISILLLNNCFQRTCHTRSYLLGTNIVKTIMLCPTVLKIAVRLLPFTQVVPTDGQK